MLFKLSDNFSQKINFRLLIFQHVARRECVVYCQRFGTVYPCHFQGSRCPRKLLGNLDHSINSV